MSFNLSEQIYCKNCQQVKGTNPINCETCFSYLNWTRLLLAPFNTNDDSTDDLQKRSIRNLNDFVKVNEITQPEVMFKYMKLFEALSAGMSLIYNAKIINDRLPDPEQAESSSRGKSKEFSDAVKAQREAQRPKKEKKLLTLREKSIAQMVAIGMSEEDAAKFVDNGLLKAGRAVNPPPEN